MAIAKSIEVLNALQADGVIGRYAIAGAVAAYNYVEPTLTEDLDVLIAFADAPDRKTPGLVTLEPIFKYLAQRGYSEHRKEGIVIEGWQVQFLPASDELDLEALSDTEMVSLRMANGDSVSVRILKPEFLIAKCLRVGRPKDLIRITQFLTEQAVNIDALCGVVSRHGLHSAWHAFCAKMHGANPCEKTDVG